MSQTALLPSAQSLINLSSYLLATRSHARSLPIPGAAESTDLAILYDAVSHPVPPLTINDQMALSDLHADLVRICTRAQQRGVKVIIDAEHRFVPYSLRSINFLMVVTQLVSSMIIRFLLTDVMDIDLFHSQR